MKGKLRFGEFRYTRLNCLDSGVLHQKKQKILSDFYICFPDDLNSYNLHESSMFPELPTMTLGGFKPKSFAVPVYQSLKNHLLSSCTTWKHNRLCFS